MSTSLHVRRAGAGSGKTYALCEHIVQRVADGLDPARILATTFTVKAAAELKGRIQSRMLVDPRIPLRDRVALAERLEVAGTWIHFPLPSVMVHVDGLGG